MKKVLLMTAALMALVCSAAAIAGDNGATTTKFEATYSSIGGGTWVCIGTRIANKNVTKDEEECTISDPSAFLPQGRTVAAPTFTLLGTTWYWFSDYDGQVATTVTFVVAGGGPDGSAHVKVAAQY